MMLAGIEAEKPGRETHAFECRQCGHSENVTAEIK
jgi:hypothetical protein